MDNSCQVIIDGTTYFIECSRINDLKFIDGSLCNISNTNITLVSSFSLDSNTYPRITCNSMRICGYRASTSYDTVPVNNPYTLVNDTFRTINFEYTVIFLLLLLIGVKLIWKN